MNRRKMLALFAAGSALVLAACSGTADDTDTSDSGGGTEESAETGEFPVTVTHAYGETTIENKPESVVTFGWMAEDFVAAVGVVPIAIPEQWGSIDGYQPWLRAEVESLGGDLPELLNPSDDDGTPDYEQILGLEPDLIYAPHSGLTEAQYDRLSEIAPTVPFAETAWMSGDWEDLLELTGQVLGEPEAAATRADEVNALLDEQLEAHPELDGASFAWGAGLSDGATALAFYNPGDARPAFLTDLGLTLDDGLQAYTDEQSGDFGTEVSLERISELEPDVWVAWTGDAETTARTLDDTLIARWPVVEQDHYYLIEDQTLGMATSAPSPLSVPWSIEQGYLEGLAAAINGESTVYTPDAG